MKRLYLIIPFVAAVAFSVLYWQWRAAERVREIAAASDPYLKRDGKSEAERELASGKLVVVHCGLLVEWFPEYAKILQKTYAIEARVIAGCELTRGIQEYASAYNKVMKERIRALHGAHVLERASAEAWNLFELRNKANNDNQALRPTPMIATPAASAPTVPTNGAAGL